MSEITKKEMEESAKNFAKKHGDRLLLKSNIAAINKMLIKRGREQELFQNILDAMNEYEEKISGQNTP